jgi:hypothetical protein
MVERIGGQHGQNLVRQGLRHDITPGSRRGLSSDLEFRSNPSERFLLIKLLNRILLHRLIIIGVVI